MGDEIEFLCINVFYKLMLSFLRGMTGHAQSFENNKYAISQEKIDL